MSVRRRARSQLVFLVFVAILCWAGASPAPATSAGPLEGVTGAVTGAVGEPVREVVETVTPPVQEVTEAATKPVEEVTQAVPPPVREVTEAATAPVEGVTEAVKPPVKAVTETVHHTAAPSGKPANEPVNQVVGTVGKVTDNVGKVVGTVGKAVPGGESATRATESVSNTAREAVENVTGTAPTTSSQASSSEGSGAASSRTGASQDPGAPNSAASPQANRTVPGQGNLFVPSPAMDGSTIAPLPRWVAYVWPALALTRPGLADLLSRWEAALRAALGGTTSDGSAAGTAAGTGPVVAGAHASGGRPEAESSSSSPFSKVTSAVGDFPYNASGAVLAYIAIVGIMLIALFVAVKWEIAHGRREGRGQ
jgi:hypothetical protein